jgi:hypothetical protein
MKGIVALLLAVSVFGCPLVCASGHAVGEDAAPGEQGGCPCCHHGDALPAEDGGCPAESEPRSGCQCVCGGAVLDEGGQHDVALDLGWSLPVMMAADDVHLVVGESRSWNAAPWPDVGMNHGRWVCCLFCTLLC